MTGNAIETTAVKAGSDVPNPKDVIEYDGVTVRFELVDDQLAAYWLDNYNTHNRKITETRVAGHVRDMIANNWPITGDTIRFANVVDPDVEGGIQKVLIDGQHRAEAIRRSKKAQICLIVEGLHIDVQEAIDTGKPRSYADTLTLRGIPNGAMNSAITRRLCIYRRGALPQTGGQASTPTKAELDAFFTAHEQEIFEATRVAYRVTKSELTIPGSVFASAYFLCSEKDQLAAKIFFEDQVIDTKQIDVTDPAHRLRHRLNNAKKDGLTANEMFLFCIKGWNHFRKNERLQTLQKPRSDWPKDITDLPIF